MAEGRGKSCQNTRVRAPDGTCSHSAAATPLPSLDLYLIEATDVRSVPQLIGKPAGVFFSTGTQNGGQETTALTFVTQLTHHGMLFVPMGYSTPLLFDLTELHGGSPYGSGTIAAGDGSRQPSEHEKKVAVHHGEHFGKIVAKLAK